MAAQKSEVTSRIAAAGDPKRVPAVKMWAGAGGLIVAFQAYVIVKWVAGPHFKRVPQGPTQPPGWMKVELIAWQALSIPVALCLIYWFAIRPWRRGGSVGVDGLIAIAAISLSFQDQLSVWAQPWFTYNSYMVNFGSWVPAVPGVSAFYLPGQVVPEPILCSAAAYVYAFLAVATVGSFVMRRARSRWERLSGPALIGLCFVVMCMVDFVIEAIVWLPLGVFEYPGGRWPVFARDTYHQYPLQEMVTMSCMFTAVACLRYFVDERGHSVVEHGIDELHGSAARKVVFRVLATVAYLNIAMLCCYTVPNTLMSLNQPEWPTEIQERSYFTDYMCGDGTDRLCPGPMVPVIHNGSAAVGPNGRLVLPPGAKLPGIVPFKK